MKHLSEKTKDFVANSSDEERILRVKKIKWIGYDKAIEVIKNFKELSEYPECSRMPNILLVGESNNGKTAIIEKFAQLNPAYMDENYNSINPVLLIQAPPEPDERRLYNIILEKLFAPYKTSEKLDSRQQRVKNLLQKLKVKIIIIDEIHHILAGVPTKQRKFLNVLKFLSNDLRISLVCVGTSDAFNALNSDPQTANRFNPIILSRWNYDKEFKRLLLSFEKLLPLKEESNLIEDSLSRKILAMSEGLIGEIAKILELSAILAIESNIEKITPNILSNIHYISPSDRKKMIYKL